MMGCWLPLLLSLYVITSSINPSQCLPHRLPLPRLVQVSPSPFRVSSGSRHWLPLHKNGRPSSYLQSTVSNNTIPLDEEMLIEPTIAAKPIDTPPETKAKLPFPVVLWRFTRPHTLIGSALAIPAIHLLAAPTLSSAFSIRMIQSILYAMIPSLLMNIYITGLNQITDVEIDKINKPNLPIASGDLSVNTATVVVSICLLSSLLMGVAHPTLASQGLNIALWGSAILGTMYSLPPIRLKRFPLLAAFCIVAVRGTIINAGFYAHAMSAGLSNTIAKGVWECLKHHPKCYLSSLFFGIFGIVIALMKDVPDVKGDAIHSIKSFSVRIGPKNILSSMSHLLRLLFFSFGVGFLRGAMSDVDLGTKVCRLLCGGAAFFMGFSAREKVKGVVPEESSQVYNYYMHLWKLFYVSYLVLPLAR